MTLLDNQMGLFREQLLGYRAENLHLFLKAFETDNWSFFPETTEKYHGAE